jgi:purine-binding chemotaxis protein CheW
MSNKTKSNDYLLFQIGEELFAVNLNNLNQIIETTELTNVPKASKLLEGIIYHNNELLPIVNFEKWLKPDQEVEGEKSNILVVELSFEEGSIEIGLMVDTVLEVVQFSSKDISNAPEVGTTTSNYISGVARYSEKFVMLVDVRSLFTKNQLETIKQSKDLKTENELEDIIREEELTNIYLTFTLGKEKLAVDANKVVEILNVPTITSIPGSNPLLAGVINIRGSILPVVDARLKFNIDISEENEEVTTVMVVDVSVDGEEMSVGAIVDTVTDIIEISEENINSAVSLDLPFNPSYLKGVAKVKGSFIQLMNSDNVFEIKTIEKNVA